MVQATKRMMVGKQGVVNTDEVSVPRLIVTPAQASAMLAAVCSHAVLARRAPSLGELSVVARTPASQLRLRAAYLEDVLRLAAPPAAPTQFSLAELLVTVSSKEVPAAMIPASSEGIPAAAASVDRLLETASLFTCASGSSRQGIPCPQALISACVRTLN